MIVLELLGMIVGNILSLPGILGFAVGMMTRNILLAAGLGALVGAGEALLFAGFDLARAGAAEIAISVLVGIAFAALGCLTRRKGATV